MKRDGSGVSALVGLDGFVVCAQLLDESTGEWWLAVETTEDRAWCESCGVRAVGHGRRRVVVGTCLLADRPVVLVWAKRVWRCGEPACAARTWSEESDQIAPRAVLTERARAEIARRVGPAEQSVAQAARDFGVSWHAAMAAVRDHGRPRVDHLTRLGAPGALGLDETSFLAATADRPTLLVTGIIDLDAGRLVDVLPARSAVAVTEWLSAKPAPWLAGIRHVVIDPHLAGGSVTYHSEPQHDMCSDGPGMVPGVTLGAARLTLRRWTWPISNPADSLGLRRLRSPCHSIHPSTMPVVRGPCSECCYGPLGHRPVPLLAPRPTPKL